MQKVYILIITFLLVGCSSTKKVVHPRQYPVETGDITINKKPENNHIQPVFVTPKKEETPATTSPEDMPAVVPMNFTERESEHIKSVDYNPFPPSGSFSIELNTLEREFTFPLASCRFSSGYGTRGGSFHSGVDLITAAGEAIFAVMDGVVRMAKPYAAYGNVIVIRHSNGLESVYSHNAKNLVKVGERVHSGQKIATVGRTGRASTNHLHFELRIQGQAINPLLVIDPARLALARGTLLVKRSADGRITAGNSQQAPPAATAPPTQSTAKNSYHTVQKGDTLSSIARRYTTSIAELCRLNGISDKSILSIGKKLKVK